MARSNSAIMLMPFSDIFGQREMGNIPGISELEWSKQNPLQSVYGNIAYPNWRKKMHIPVEHIEDVEMFREVAQILGKYRPDGNNGKGRYYQFERLGNNNASTIDFEKFKRIHDIIKYKEAYRMEQLIQNRYSQAYKNRLTNRFEINKTRYDNMIQAWAKHKKAHGL